MSNYTQIDFGALEDAKSLLAPFKEVTVIMSSEKKVTVSLVHPLKTRLLNHLRNLQPSTSAIKAARTVMLDDLASRYALIFH